MLRMLSPGSKLFGDLLALGKELCLLTYLDGWKGKVAVLFAKWFPKVVELTFSLMLQDFGNGLVQNKSKVDQIIFLDLLALQPFDQIIQLRNLLFIILNHSLNVKQGILEYFLEILVLLNLTQLSKLLQLLNLFTKLLNLCLMCIINLLFLIKLKHRPKQTNLVDLFPFFVLLDLL